jgi:hypothetical protein
MNAEQNPRPLLTPKDILALPEDQQREFWRQNIAVHYYHEGFSKKTTPRGLNWCFRRWQKDLKKLVGTEA